MLTRVALVSVLATSALAQSSYMTGLLEALRNNSLTTLADVLTTANASAFESTLSSGNHTVFAPDNNAFASLGSTPSNATEIQQVTSYHLLTGLITTNDTSPDNFTIARTTLKGPPAVNLPGNQPQAIVLSKTTSGKLTVVDAASGQNITSSTTFKYQNLQIEVIPNTLTIPGNISETIASRNELSALVTTTGSVQPDFPRALSQIKGVTVFAPVNSAITNNAQQLGSATPQTIHAVLLNHLINGTVAYSPQITNGMTLTTAGGGTLTFTTNSSGIFVSAANSTARITTPNILASNGVVHLIDNILFDTTYNPAAASSAIASATSAQAAQTSVQTGPVTQPATATGSGGPRKIQSTDGIVVAIMVVGLGAFLA